MSPSSARAGSINNAYCSSLAMPGQPELRDPSTLHFQKDGVRRWIIATYWLVIIAALPLWWWTTSIERLALPSAQVTSQTEKHLRIPIDICIDDAFNMAADLEGVKHNLERKLGSDKWKGVDIRVHRSATGSFECTYTISPSENITFNAGRSLGVPVQDRDRVVDILASLIGSSPACTNDLRVVQYASHYRLSFSLLNEDGAAGDFYASWEITRLLGRHIDPVVRSLSTLHNFTVESQVQIHAPLAFSPIPAGDENGWEISREDLSVFINSAEWTLSSSSSNDPVLHFVLFIPSATRRPLYILDKNDIRSPSNSFLLPQWGGIVIHNPPEPLSSGATLALDSIDGVFSSFAQHLLALLGAPHLPAGIDSTAPSKHMLMDWQLDTLLRCRALSNAQGTGETLQSILSLVDQIPNMPVGPGVRNDIQDSLSALEQMHKSPDSLVDTLRHSAQALTLASRAFFNPGMLALLYFPAEHKYAVYTPMFASALIPPLVAVLREFSAWRRQRAQSTATASQ